MSVTEVHEKTAIDEAVETAERRARQLVAAQEALREIVRTSGGRLSPGVVDQVVESFSLPSAVVQRALWGLVARGELNAGDDLVLTKTQP